jgi:hypothetical protein
MSRMNRALIIGSVLVAVWGCSSFGINCGSAQGSGSCLRVLFIGNSYTFVNDLPGTFTALAESGGHKVEMGMAATGGWTLAQHAASAATLDAIKSSKWDYVVLQEQSELPSVPQMRTQEMYPAARLLAGQIRAAGAKPLFFITWAHQDGWPDYGMHTYEAMQTQIDQGYLLIARELNAQVAPVGLAWWMARRQDPQLGLWQADGSHPTLQGTYLAACVFYAAIFRQSPIGLTYVAGLPQETARSLQSAAANAFFLFNP